MIQPHCYREIASDKCLARSVITSIYPPNGKRWALDKGMRLDHFLPEPRPDVTSSTSRFSSCPVVASGSANT